MESDRRWRRGGWPVWGSLALVVFWVWRAVKFSRISHWESLIFGFWVGYGALLFFFGILGKRVPNELRYFGAGTIAFVLLLCILLASFVLARRGGLHEFATAELLASGDSIAGVRA